MSSSSPNGELKPVIGTRSLMLNAVNQTIGTSIFVAPAIVSLQLDGASILGYIACAFMFMLIVLCYIEVASRVKGSGGSYAYVEEAFGPFAGFLTNAVFVIGWSTASDAAGLNLVADTLSVLFPVFSNPFFRAAFSILLLGILTYINVRGAKQGVRLTNFTTITKLTPLLLLAILGWAFVSKENLRWEQMPTAKSLGDASLFLFFLFAGFETSVNASSEIKNPKRTIPAALLLSIGVVTIFYLLIQQVTLGVLGPRMQEFRNAPVAAVAEMMIGPAGSILIVCVTAFSLFSLLSGDVLVSPRMLYAGARSGLYPKFLGKVHPRFETPYWAVIVYTLLIFLFSISGGFKQLAILSSGALLLIYFAVVLAMIKLRRRKQIDEEKTFKVPGGLIIPSLAVILIVWVFSHLKQNEILSIAIFLAVMCVIYFVMKMKRQSIVNEEQLVVESVTEKNDL